MIYRAQLERTIIGREFLPGVSCAHRFAAEDGGGGIAPERTLCTKCGAFAIWADGRIVIYERYPKNRFQAARRVQKRRARPARSRADHRSPRVRPEARREDLS